MLRGSRLCALASLAGGFGMARAASNTSTGSTIIYVVIGLVVLLFLIAAALVWRCYRNRARRRAERAHTFEPQAFHQQAPSMATYRMDMLHAEDVDDREAHKHRRDEATPEAVYEMHPRTPVTELGEFQDARSEDNRSADNRSADNRSAGNRSGDNRSEEDLEAAATQADYPPYDDGRGQRAHSRGSDSRSTQGSRATQDSRATYDRQARASDQVARSPFQQQDELLSHDPPPAAAAEDLSATAAAKRLRKDNENAAARAQDTLARVLNEFETDPLFAGRRLPFSSLYYTRVLSKGAFGEVWLAQLESRQVAVKRILSEKKNDPKEVECFAAEIKLMTTFNHPKIVEFVGISGSTLQDLCAITEYMGRGDLYNFLKRYVGKLSWRDHKIFLAEDVADALGYLHSLSPKVIHRDLKSKNILLDDVFRAKLSDFGISRERSVEETMTAGVGTIYWTAPEVLMGKKYTEKADIYSFGIVMSELDTHQVPYSDKRDDSGKKLQGMKVVANVIRRNLRPTLSSACPPQVQALTARCVDVDPAARPDAFELLALIRQIEDELA